METFADVARQRPTLRLAPLPPDLSNYPDSYRIRAETVRRLLGVGAATLYRMKKAGKLPPSIKLSATHRTWALGDIRAFLKKLEAEQAEQAEQEVA